MFQKISEWLSDCGSHEIYGLKGIAADFEKCTGQIFPSYVRTYSTEETRAAMTARGLGGTLAQNPEKSDRVVWGYVMAQDFAAHLAQFQTTKIGRGFIMRECIEAIAKAGY